MHAPGAAAVVHVRVTGELRVPLQLRMLRLLDDNALERDIIAEAVRLAVAERVGYFDDMHVTYTRRTAEHATRDRDNHTNVRQITHDDDNKNDNDKNGDDDDKRDDDNDAVHHCEVTLSLDKLGGCLRRIQRAYDDMRACAQQMHDLLQPPPPPLTCHDNDNTQSTTQKQHNDNNDNSAADAAATRQAQLQALLQTMLTAPTRIVDAAATTACDAADSDDADDTATCVDAHTRAEQEQQHDDNVDDDNTSDTATRPLLGGDAAATTMAASDDDDDDAYAQLGYTRL